MKSRWDAGQYKLKGKKEKKLSCRCCIVRDKRNIELEKESKGVVAYEIQKRAENKGEES